MYFGCQYIENQEKAGTEKIGSKGKNQKNEVLVLELALQEKEKECDQLSEMLYWRDATIARKTTISLMKDDELNRLRMEVKQLKAKQNELEQQM